jgi:Zn-dependent M28 family amino/carboxypeptidase
MSAAPSSNAGPRVVVALFNGEEQGLYGSRALVDQYREWFAGGMMVNVDMVGHSRSLPMEVSALDGSQDLADLMEALIREAGLSTRRGRGGMSDHASFQGVTQAVLLVQSPYFQMHLSSDAADRVEADVLERLVECLVALADGVQAMPERK